MAGYSYLMQLPGLIFGLFFIASGAIGLIVWMRLSGMLKPAHGDPGLGFDEGRASVITASPQAERVEYNLFESESPFGHRMASLLGIVVFIVSVGGLFALVLVEIGHQTTKLIQHFILTSPSP
jgi:hypothetical protein